MRRHARLVDYYLHEGCNARAFVHFDVADGAADQMVPKGTRLLTKTIELPTVIEKGSRDEERALDAGALVFETASDSRLRRAHNRFVFYTWGIRRELPMQELKNYTAFKDRMLERPAVQRVVKEESVKV